MRQFVLLRVSVFSLTLLTLALGAYAQDPFDIGSRRELFVDSHLIAEFKGEARLELHRPSPAEVVLRVDKPWEGAFNYGHAVIKDGDTYRMYYRGLDLVDKPFGKDFGTSYVCYAESKDGVNWVKPNLGLTQVAGTWDNNAVVSEEGDNVGNYTFIDTKPGVPKDERYKTIEGEPEARRAYVSPDGIHWRRLQDDPVIDKSHYPYGTDGAGCNAFWSESEGRYVGYYRTWINDEHEFTETSPRYRWIGRCTSPDFVNWSKVEAADFGEVPIEHYYTQRIQPYYRAPHIYVGLPARFMPERQVLTPEEIEATGVYTSVGRGEHNYAVECSDGLLVTSRGGNQLDRTFPGAFIRPGMGAGNWVSRTNYPLRGVVQTGPAEMSLYVNRHYAQDSWHIQRFTLRPDGFISVHAPYGGGEMLSKPLIFTGNRLELNVSTSAGGSVRVGLQDASGTPIDGYSADDCDQIIGDELAHVVTWNGDSNLEDLAGMPVRLHFVLKEADVYSFRFNEAE